MLIRIYSACKKAERARQSNIRSTVSVCATASSLLSYFSRRDITAYELLKSYGVVPKCHPNRGVHMHVSVIYLAAALHMQVRSNLFGKNAVAARWMDCGIDT